MKMSEYLQKKRILLIISTILIIAFVVISIIIYNKKNKESNNIQEQDLSITYNISKSDVAPRDEASAPLSTINIKNNKSYQQKYQLIVKPDDKSTLGLDKIYISIDGNNKLLSDWNELTNPTISDIANFHYKFEMIHSFLDGNGRIGRFII